MLDIAIEDDLKTIFAPDNGGYDQASFDLRGKIWADDRTLVGASDAGAHLDLIDNFAFSTAFLQKGVREHKVIGLEAAIHQITQRPAIYFGLVERGVIAKNHWADLVIFDPETVGRGPTYQRFDIPGSNEFRLYAEAQGIPHVFVNGTQIIKNGEHTGKMPGTVLRSGVDTKTMPIGALRKAA
jgi:N-acyl-D-aspartate/D-glutamate deacylase